jgi:nucleotide-binding universal stress UspA family protein
MPVRPGSRHGSTVGSRRFPRRVVVGVAGHASSLGPLAWAIAESEVTGAQLVVVHATGQRRGRVLVPEREIAASVAGGISGGLGAGGSLGALEAIDRFAAGAVAAARARLGESSVRIVVDAGPPGEVLVREAGSGDVLVVGGPPRSGWWVRSGTTNHVVPRARCPVIVVHERDRQGEPPPEAGEPGGRGGALLRGDVVVGLAESGRSRAALAYGFAFADRHALGLVVTRVLPPADDHLWIGDGPTGSAEPPAAAELAAEVEPWRRRYAHVPVTRVVVTGTPTSALRLAGAQAALLVIGAGGTAMHPLSAVCRSLVAAAGCPVAVVHRRWAGPISREESSMSSRSDPGLRLP